MNYLSLRRTIWAISTLAFALSFIALIFVLMITRSDTKGPDFAGAGALAVVIPSFASALLAAVSMYAFIKSEDPVLKESDQVILSAQKLSSLFDTWISTIALAWQTGHFTDVKPMIESTRKIVIDLLLDHHTLEVLSAKYNSETEKQGTLHAASRLILAIHLICSSAAGTDPANLKTPSGDIVLSVLLQSMDRLLDDMADLPPAETIRSIIASSRKATMRNVLAEIMKQAHVSKWQ